MTDLEAELERRVGTRIKRAEQTLIAEKTRVLKPFEITVPQYAALLYLRHVSTASAAQLARASGVSPQTMATILTNLEHKGLVERTTSPLHQKVLETRLTAKGADVVSEADAAARSVEDRILASFSDVEVRMLKDLLDRAMEAITDDH